MADVFVAGCPVDVHCEDGQWQPGVVHRHNDDGTFTIYWDDGSLSKVSAECLRSRSDDAGTPEEQPQSSSFSIGDDVEVDCDGEGWLPATVLAENEDGTVTVAMPDGSEVHVDPSCVRADSENLSFARDDELSQTDSADASDGRALVANPDAAAPHANLVDSIISHLRLNGRSDRYGSIASRLHMKMPELMDLLKSRSHFFQMFKNSVHLCDGVAAERDADLLVQILSTVKANPKRMPKVDLKRRSTLKPAEFEEMLAAHPDLFEVSKKSVALRARTSKTAPKRPCAEVPEVSKRPKPSCAPGLNSTTYLAETHTDFVSKSLRTGEVLGTIAQKKNFNRFVEEAIGMAPTRYFTVQQLHAEFIAAGGGESTPSVQDFARFNARIQEQFGVDPNTGHVVVKANALDLTGMVRQLLEDQPEGKMDLGLLGSTLQKMLNVSSKKNRPIKQFIGKGRSLGDYLRGMGYTVEGSIISL